MSHPQKAKEEDFRWGKKGRFDANTNLQFYKSFTYDGVEYFVYDSVYLWRDGEAEPDIGKIVKIYETEKLSKKIMVIWFFRPADIHNFLGDVKPHENEIFLASGEGKGLCNYNPLEAIAGKCNVVCTSKDRRNPPASKAELRMADYIFFRTFDVENLILSDNFPDTIAKIKVECFFNRKKDQDYPLRLNPTLKESAEKSNSPPKFVLGKTLRDAGKGGEPGSATGAENRPFKKRKLQGTSGIALHESPSHDDAIKITDKAAAQLAKGKGVKHDSQVFENTKNKSNWFKERPWEVRMKEAHEAGTLVLLENLDPSYTLSEVEHIVWNAFAEKVAVKMIAQTAFSCPQSGKAFVIFKSKEKAEKAISELNKRCLMLPKGRPLIGSIGIPRMPDGPPKFVGHLKIDSERVRRLLRQREEMRNAVSTSHSSQSNTIEYEMAMEWRILQEKSDAWWKALHEQQADEVKALKRQLKYL